MGMRCAPRMKRCAKLRVIDKSYTSSSGWKCCPRVLPPRVVPLVMKMRSVAAGGSQRSGRALKASMGTAGMSAHDFTLRRLTPRNRQKLWNGWLAAYWCANRRRAIWSNCASVQPSIAMNSRRSATSGVTLCMSERPCVVFDRMLRGHPAHRRHSAAKCARIGRGESSSSAGITRFKFSGVDLSTCVHPGAKARF